MDRQKLVSSIWVPSYVETLPPLVFCSRGYEAPVIITSEVDTRTCFTETKPSTMFLNAGPMPTASRQIRNLLQHQTALLSSQNPI